MVRLNREFFDVPTMLGALALDKLPTVPGDIAGEHGLAPFRASEEMEHDELNPMFVSLIIHVDSRCINVTIDG